MGRADQVIEVTIARRKAGRKHLPVTGTLSGIFRGETAAVQRHRLQTVVVLLAGHDGFITSRRRKEILPTTFQLT
jgi:hypothetical protein